MLSWLSCNSIFYRKCPKPICLIFFFFAFLFPFLLVSQFQTKKNNSSKKQFPTKKTIPNKKNYLWQIINLLLREPALFVLEGEFFSFLLFCYVFFVVTIPNKKNNSQQKKTIPNEKKIPKPKNYLWQIINLLLCEPALFVLEGENPICLIFFPFLLFCFVFFFGVTIPNKKQFPTRKTTCGRL